MLEATLACAWDVAQAMPMVVRLRSLQAAQHLVLEAVPVLLLDKAPKEAVSAFKVVLAQQADLYR